MYKSIIPVRNDTIHWDKYLYNPLFCTSRFVHLCGGRSFWVGRIDYGNLFYPSYWLNVFETTSLPTPGSISMNQNNNYSIVLPFYQVTDVELLC